MAAATRKFRSQGVNQYVPAMQSEAEINNGGLVSVSLGTPATIVAAGLLSAIAANALSQKYYPADFNGSAVVANADSPYGRTLRVTPSADPGATGITLDVRGEDYLGQPMIERFVMPNGASAAIEGKKAFYRVLSAQVVVAATNAVTYSVGFSNGLGLPYKAKAILEAIENGSVTASGTTAAADETDPGSRTTGDPRGTYKPNAALDGVKETKVTFRPDNAVNASNNGGLHGIRQFYA